jgi:hypothetical protein
MAPASFSRINGSALLLDAYFDLAYMLQRAIFCPTSAGNSGHADIKMTMRYTHAISNDRREAVERATQMF